MNILKKISKLFNNVYESTQPNVKHQINSVNWDGEKLIVNGETIDISQFNTQRLRITQINGKLEVNGLVYDFDEKKFYPRNL